MKKMLFALLAVVSMFPAFTEEAIAQTLSWTAPTHYTDNTLIGSAVIEFRPYWTYDKNLATENLNLIPMTDNTATFVVFDPTALGMNEDSPVYFTVTATVSGLSSAKSNSFKWYVGASGWSGPWDVRLMELPWSTGRGNFAVSWSAPRDNNVNPAFYRLYGSANSFGNVQAGMLLYQGTNRSACATIGGNIDNGVAVQVVAYNASGGVLGWSEKAFFLPGAFDCEDIVTCRVDFAHTYSILDTKYGQYLSDLGQSPRPDIPQCGTGSEFIVPTLTVEQLTDRNGDGRIDYREVLDTNPLLGNRTVR